ncbi:hypothetical protein FB45DRAFT_88155 [Roridomyces roridus]|uniref:DUF7330 domain-containing protein n=1 Tax=Roridomyces roridus TaxID=1738132 RepID=A0AAD7FHU2_9AGAR|nr:hypothetical protein FB45DRAFT_88155 [Roridomyces roridus]
MPSNKQDQKPLLPTTVEILSSGLRPYAETAEFDTSLATALEDWDTKSPQNDILVSRNFGSLKTRFTVDPNIHPPNPLLPAVSSWEKDEQLSSNGKISDVAGAELYVGWGQIDAEVCVLPLSENAVCEQNGYPCRRWAKGADGVSWDRPPPCPMKSRVSASTFIGDVTAKVDIGKLSPCTPRLILQAMSSWGQVAVFLPRSFQGSLVTSCSGTPRFSSTLAPLCTSIKEVGREKHWFVGDVYAWRAHADDVIVGSVFGTVWVGYEGEEEEAKKALRWGPVQWLVHIIAVALILWFMRIAFGVLLWFSHII